MGNRGPDMRLLAESLKSSGIDTRVWCSYGTVGIVSDDGEFDTEDYGAIHIGADCITVDVLLEPSGIPCTARMQLGIGSTAAILAPIKPGDQVLCHIPSGIIQNGVVISAILSNPHAKFPVKTDKMPVFQNDKLLLYVGNDLPVEVNAKRINLGDETAAQPVPLGNTWKDTETKILNAIQQITVPSPFGPLGPPINSPAFQQIAQSDLDPVLSTRAFLKD